MPADNQIWFHIVTGMQQRLLSGLAIGLLIAGPVTLPATAAEQEVSSSKKPEWALPKVTAQPGIATRSLAQNERPSGLFETADPFAPQQAFEAPPVAKEQGNARSSAQPTLPVLRNDILKQPVNLPEPQKLAEPTPLSAPRQQLPTATRRDPFLVPTANNEAGTADDLGAAAFPAIPIAPPQSENTAELPIDNATRMTPPESSIFAPPVKQPAPTNNFPEQQPFGGQTGDISPIESPQPTQTPQLSQPDPFANSNSLQQTTNRQLDPVFEPPQAAIPAAEPQSFYNPPTSTTQPVPANPSQNNIPKETVHEVQPGENYWTISRQHFGTARYFAALSEYNKHRIPRPDRMKPGMFVLVPDVEVLEQRYPKIAGIVDSKPSPESLLAPGFFIAPNGQPMYRIGKGDTLTDIAEQHLGRTARWTQIVGMNRDVLNDGHNLKIGMVLKLPHDASQVALAPAVDIIR